MHCKVLLVNIHGICTYVTSIVLAKHTDTTDITCYIITIICSIFLSKVYDL